MAQEIPKITIESSDSVAVELETMFNQNPELAARIVRSVEAADPNVIPKPLELC